MRKFSVLQDGDIVRETDDIAYAQTLARALSRGAKFAIVVERIGVLAGSGPKFTSGLVVARFQGGREVKVS